MGLPEPPSAPGRFRASTETLRETTKWLVAVFAALGSVLVAGLRFGDVGRLDLGTGPSYLAIAGATFALIAIGYVLFSAGRVLVSQYYTLRQVLQTAEEQEEKNKALPAQLSHEMIREIEREKDYLFSWTGAATLQELYRELRSTSERLVILRRDQPLAQQDEQRLRARRQELQDAMDGVADFADHWVTKERFRHLLWSVGVSAVAATVGIFLFSVGASRADVPVRAPTNVTVFLNGAGQRWVQAHLGCKTSVLKAVAVGGDLAEPEVVVPAGSGCDARRFVVSGDLGVAVPISR